jgi:glucose-6-phosphate isomerase
MSDGLRLDMNYAMEEQIGPTGLSATDWSALSSRSTSIHQAISASRKAGKLPFFDLPRDAAAADAAIQMGLELAQSFDDLLVLGIGGSSLGAKALFAALSHPYHNLLPKPRRKGMRAFFPDNSDGVTFASLLEIVELRRTAIAAITKSGGTAETWAQVLQLDERFRAQGLDLKNQLVAVTDPEKGALRQVARRLGLRSLPVPPGVGGRFSVLTAVGLLPAAAFGVDVKALLQGAADMVERCQSSELQSNPAYALASVLYSMDVNKKRRIHVLMPYADALRETADWFVQLWAESLGKQAPEGAPSKDGVGPTPLRAVGATDQHSLLQLVMEGPSDKVVVFVAVEQPRVDLPIPNSRFNESDVDYLGGHSFHALLSAEQKATAAALAKNGRPSVTLQMKKLDAHGMGQLLMLLEIATAYAGGLYQVNPYDQPGVEAGKRYACGLLGRPGYEEAKRELDQRPALNARWIL